MPKSSSARRGTALCASVALLVLGIFATALAQIPTTDVPHYNLPFGDNPWAPSQSKTQFKGFLRVQDIPTATYCGKCHQKSHREWRESAHANSFRGPFYEKNIKLLIEQRGIEVTRHCESCHNPVALFTGALTTGSTIDRGFDQDGVTCVMCHSITKVENTSGIGSYELGVPATMVNEDGTPRPGMATDQEIKARPDLHRRAVAKDFYKSSEYCAVCHKASVVKPLNGYKRLRAFSDYDEWQQSSWSRESPLPFYKKDTVSTCNTCHMELVDAEGDQGHKNGKIASHRTLGANSAYPVVYGYPEQLRQTEAFLKDNLAVDIFAITKGSLDEPALAPLDRSAFSLMPGEAVTFDIVIQNKKIGHALVPEQRDIKEAWVEFKVTDDSGRVIYHSGFLKPDGHLEERAHTYMGHLVGADGKRLLRHEVWRTKIKGYDNTIMAGRSELVRYQFKIPRDARGQLHITARVRHRRFSRLFTDWVFGQSREFPIFDLGSKSITLKLGHNSGTPAPKPDADLLRWNNYGIALLDEQQFERAAAAFERVIRINPKYVDGYINVGVTHYTAGSYREALRWLQQALARDPNNMRARFYTALTLRWQFKYEQAIENFLPVVAAYPRLRQARQELGYVYLQLQRYEEAREQYEKLQEIDPDDVLAHRWLIPVYTALGLKDKAAEQAQLTADRKDDPVAMWTVQEYWRQHPDVAAEVVPYHVHAEDPAVNAAGVKKLLNLANPPSQIWIQGDMSWTER